MLNGVQNYKLIRVQEETEVQNTKKRKSVPFWRQTHGTPYPYQYVRRRRLKCFRKKVTKVRNVRRKKMNLTYMCTRTKKDHGPN